jgi:hypothetical protein
VGSISKVWETLSLLLKVYWLVLHSNLEDSFTMSCSNASSSDGLIVVPREADVLCGRGRAIRDHPGNQRFILLIQNKKNSYSTAVKGWKLEIVKSVVQAIRDHNGRFLQRQGASWVDTGDDKAMIKTSQAFRDLRGEEATITMTTTTTTTTTTTVNDGNPQCGLLTDKKKCKPRLGFLVNRWKAKQKRLEEATAEESSSSSEEEEENTGSKDSGSDEESSVSSSTSSSSSDDAGDVSETETEDSFPTYRGSK